MSFEELILGLMEASLRRQAAHRWVLVEVDTSGAAKWGSVSRGVMRIPQ